MHGYKNININKTLSIKLLIYISNRLINKYFNMNKNFGLIGIAGYVAPGILKQSKRINVI